MCTPQYCKAIKWFHSGIEGAPAGVFQPLMQCKLSIKPKRENMRPLATCEQSTKGAALISLPFLLVVAILFALTTPQFAHADENETGGARIHVLAISDMDAIIVESDGHFGMVDSGEDSDFPDGSDPRYPQRVGTTEGEGHEEEVIAYMESLGINSENFDFYLGTHPHSDHIGSASLIIQKFKPKRIYTQRYDDSYILGSGTLWDNQYVYDKLIVAANTAGEEYGAALILDYDESAPVIPQNGSTVGCPSFYLGQALIQIMNTDPSYQEEGAADGNWFSLGVKVTAGHQAAFLAGDICNSDGDEDALAPLIGHVNFLKLGHHGNAGSGTEEFIKALSPDIVFYTRGPKMLWGETLEALTDVGATLYNASEFSESGVSAFVVELADGNTTTNAPEFGLELRYNWYTKHFHAYIDGKPTELKGWYETESGSVYFNNSTENSTDIWLEGDGGHRESQYINSDGKLASGWVRISDLWYYFDEKGRVKTGWLHIGNTWYYLKPGSGVMATGSAIIDGERNIFSLDGVWRGVTAHDGWNNVDGTWFYIDENGENATGWLASNGNWYYLQPSGAMVCGWELIDNNWHFFSASGAMQTGWVWDSAWYFLDSSGIMETGWMETDNGWYYLASNGAMQTGWTLVGSSWYYLGNSGAMQTGWLELQGIWYHLDDSGAMQTGWLDLGPTTYYMSDSGAMQTGWNEIDADWYCFANSGALEKNCWVGNYYLESNGAMARNKWIGPYYVGDDGCWIPNY